jgi:tRNA (uracil-5-)-methyltransferase
MECQHFGQCGSCTLYAQSYDEQVADKKRRVAALLAPYLQGGLVGRQTHPVEAIEVFVSDESHYRSRAEFRIWHTRSDGEERCDYAMGTLTKDGTLTIQACPKVTGPIDRVMSPLRGAINASDVLGHKLFAVEFLAATDGEVLVTLIYHRRLDTVWETKARELAKKLNLHIIGRSRKQKVILSRDYVTETLTIEGVPYRYRYHEGGFTQPNPAVNTRMISWAVRQVEGIGGDLLELYCGLGNFTLPLARQFERVLATEVSKTSIRAARENIAINSTDNITFVRMSSEEMVEAFEGARPFRRLEQEGVVLDKYTFSTVMVDPPRAGLDLATTALTKRFEYILYISCNPETLARDLATLTRTHTVVAAAIFDQFPHTEHVESGVILKKQEPHL